MPAAGRSLARDEDTKPLALEAALGLLRLGRAEVLRLKDEVVSAQRTASRLCQQHANASEEIDALEEENTELRRQNVERSELLKAMRRKAALLEEELATKDAEMREVEERPGTSRRAEQWPGNSGICSLGARGAPKATALRSEKRHGTTSGAEVRTIANEARGTYEDAEISAVEERPSNQDTQELEARGTSGDAELIAVEERPGPPKSELQIVRWPSSWDADQPDTRRPSGSSSEDVEGRGYWNDDALDSLSEATTACTPRDRELTFLQEHVAELRAELQKVKMSQDITLLQLEYTCSDLAGRSAFLEVEQNQRRLLQERLRCLEEERQDQAAESLAGICKAIEDARHVDIRKERRRKGKGLIGRATHASLKVRAVAWHPCVQVTTTTAVAGACVAGVGGAATGVAVGVVSGFAVSLLAAPFTLGLSIPIGAAFGGSVGGMAGAAAGTTAGAVSGGAVGYGVYARRDQIFFVVGGLVNVAKKATRRALPADAMPE